MISESDMATMVCQAIQRAETAEGETFAAIVDRANPGRAVVVVQHPSGVVTQQFSLQVFAQ